MAEEKEKILNSEEIIAAIDISGDEQAKTLKQEFAEIHKESIALAGGLDKLFNNITLGLHKVDKKSAEVTERFRDLVAGFSELMQSGALRDAGNYLGAEVIAKRMMTEVPNVSSKALEAAGRAGYGGGKYAPKINIGGTEEAPIFDYGGAPATYDHIEKGRSGVFRRVHYINSSPKARKDTLTRTESFAASYESAANNQAANPEHSHLAYTSGVMSKSYRSNAQYYEEFEPFLKSMEKVASQGVGIDALRKRMRESISQIQGINENITVQRGAGNHEEVERLYRRRTKLSSGLLTDRFLLNRESKNLPLVRASKEHQELIALTIGTVKTVRNEDKQRGIEKARKKREEKERKEGAGFFKGVRNKAKTQLGDIAALEKGVERARVAGNTEEAELLEGRIHRVVMALSKTMKQMQDVDPRKKSKYAPKDWDAVERQVESTYTKKTSYFDEKAEDKARAKEDAEDTKRFAREMKATIAHIKRAGNYEANIENHLKGAERRVINYSEGRGKEVDFSNIEHRIAEGVRRGIITQEKADEYGGEVKHLKGLQERGVGLMGEAAQFKERQEKYRARAEAAKRTGDLLDAAGDKGGAAQAYKEWLTYSRRMAEAEIESKDLLRRIAERGGMYSTHKELEDFARQSAIRGIIHNGEAREKVKEYTSRDRMHTDGLGGWVKRELRGMPGGKFISSTMGNHVANAVNKKGADILTTIAGTTAGRVFMNTGVGKAVMEGGKRLIGTAAAGLEVAGGSAALMGMVTNPVTIGLVVAAAGAYFANKAANKAYNEGSEARKEELGAMNLARRSGISDRLIDDFRESDGMGGNGAIKDIYARLGYSSGEVLNYMEQAGISGLSKKQRQSTTELGLTIARQHGLEVGEAASVQAELKRSTIQGSEGDLESDMSRFSLMLSEAVKRGAGSTEVSQAFKTALSSSTQLAGGKLFETQNEFFMKQMLSVSRSDDPYMKGTQGIGTIQKMNDTLGNVSGLDRAFFYTAFQGKSAEDLGYKGKQAKDVQSMLNQNPELAMGYIMKNQTEQGAGVVRDHIFKSAGGDFTLAQSMFQRSGMNEVQASTAALQYQDEWKRTGGKVSDIHVAEWDAWSGRNGEAKKEDINKSLGDVQASNSSGQIAQRQEANAQEIKMRASRVSFDSVSGQILIQSVQSVRLAAESGKKEIQKTSKPVKWGWNKRHEGETVGKGYSSGGYTGNGGVGEIAGVVHGQEFVVNAQGTANNRELLEYLNKGGKVSGFRAGGFTGGSTPRGSSQENNHALIAVLTDLNTTLRGMDGGYKRADLSSIGKSGTGNMFEVIGNVFQKALGGLGGLIKTKGATSGTEGAGDTESNIVQTATQQGASGGEKGARMASVAAQALMDSTFVSAAKYCSRFVRQVTERALGKEAASGLFGGSAIETGNLWKKRGLTRSLSEVNKMGGLREGDVLFQMSGSEGAGHTGVVIRDKKTGRLQVAENTTKSGKGVRALQGSKKISELSAWGKIDLVGRMDGWNAQGASPATGTGQTVSVLKKGSKGTTDGSDLERLIWGIAEQESRHDYTVRNARTGAMGMYQIMPQNILGWGKNAGKKGVGWDFEALGRDITVQEFMANPELQEKIARFQISKIYKSQLKATGGNSKAAMERTARVWYSGSPEVGTRGVGNEPTTLQYGRKVLERAMKAPVSSAPSKTAVSHSGQISVTVTTNGKPDGKLTAAVNNAIAQKIASKVIPPSPSMPRTRSRPGG